MSKFDEYEIMKLRYFFCVMFWVCALFCPAVLCAQDCVACERVSRFDTLRKQMAAHYWPGFAADSFTGPLFYYTKEETYMILPNKQVSAHFAYSKLNCPGKTALYKLAQRTDDVPFHMENNTELSDSTSPYYFNPIMRCSDADAAKELIGDVKHTEEWLAMVMHEYFHNFQFRHRYMLRYMADSIRMPADTLNRIYFGYDWFKESVIQENTFLLQALSAASKDSVRYYISAFASARNARRAKFKSLSSFEIERFENFWEKIEGTARYMEYNLAYVFQQAVLPGVSCDTIFNEYKEYRDGSIFRQPWMKSKTLVEGPYFYVIGFNLCRVMDKLNISYKQHLFDGDISLHSILMQHLQ